jgi:glyoxylate/hydroxypyruvate reductase A
LPTFLYKADPERGVVWARVFAERAPQLTFRIWPDEGDPRDVEYVAAWRPPEGFPSRYPNLRAVFCTGAGIDNFDLPSIPAHVPFARMIEPGITGQMVEYVTFAVLALHRDMPLYRVQQASEEWKLKSIVPASQRRVGVMGSGQLGSAVLSMLARFGFDCASWSRSRHAIDGVRSYAGSAELGAFLARTDILVCLVPLTDQTRGILDAKLFGQLPRGASLVHAGRGAHLVDADLRAALDSGQLDAVVTDVTDPEPLPPGHWMWSHPRVWVTPHIATMTQPESAADVVLENLRRLESGETMIGLVDRKRGY